MISLVLPNIMGINRVKNANWKVSTIVYLGTAIHSLNEVHLDACCIVAVILTCVKILYEKR